MTNSEWEGASIVTKNPATDVIIKFTSAHKTTPKNVL